MDFNLVQAYLKKLPKVADLTECYEVKVVMGKYSESVVVEFLENLINERHKEIVTSESENDLNQLDFSLDYYINKLKKSLAVKKGKPLKKIINCLGTVYSEYIGGSFYSQEVIKKFDSVFSGYSNLELDEENGTKIPLDDEIRKFFTPIVGDKDFLVVNSVGSALFLIISLIFKDKKVIASLSDSFCFDNSVGIQDIIIEAEAELKRVGYINQIQIQDYLKEIVTKEELLIYSNLFENNIPGIPKLKEKDILSLKEIVPVLYITNRVYIQTNSEEIKRLGKSIDNIIAKNYPINLFDLSVLANCPDAGIIIGDKEYIDKIKDSFIYKAFTPSKETKALLYFVLKMYMENKSEQIFVNQAFSKNHNNVKENNRKFLRKLEREIGEDVEIKLLTGDYLKLGESFPGEFSFKREIICLNPKNKDIKEIERQLRLSDPSILCWLSPDGLLICLQMVSEEEEEIVLDTLKDIL